MNVCCGIDVGRRRSEFVVMDRRGRVLFGTTITNDLDGVAKVMDTIRLYCRQPRAEVPIAVDEVNALVPSTLAYKGFLVLAVHPVAEARHRKALVASGLKTDRTDAFVLANIARTEPHVHRHFPASSPAAVGIRILARAQQDAAYDLRRVHSRVDAHLALYFPGALETFPNLLKPEPRLVLRMAPSPRHARSLRHRELVACLRELWSEPRCVTRAASILEGLRAPHLRLPLEVEEVMAEKLVALLTQLDTAIDTQDRGTEAALARFRKHADYEIYSSFPGLSGILGARILGELGDDESRFAHDWSMGALAGVVPVTRASGDSMRVQRRLMYNRRLGHAVNLWTLPLLTCSPEARRYYDARRAAGDRHSTASRKLGRRYLRILRRCLVDHRAYEEREHAASTQRIKKSVAS